MSHSKSSWLAPSLSGCHFSFTSSSSTSHSSYSHFDVRSMYDDISFHVERSYIAAYNPFSLIYHSLLCPTIFSQIFLSSFSLYINFHSLHSYMRCAPLFSSHAHTISHFRPSLKLLFTISYTYEQHSKQYRPYISDSLAGFM